MTHTIDERSNVSDTDYQPLRQQYTMEELMWQAKRFKDSNALNLDEAGILYEFVMELFEDGRPL